MHDVTTILKRNVCSFISDYDVQIALGARVEPPQNSYITQIQGQTNYARSAKQPFPSNTGLRFSCEMAVATIGPFQMSRSLCVIDMNFTILRHFLLKLCRNEFHDNSTSSSVADKKVTDKPADDIISTYGVPYISQNKA
jgi:hypothetical protein